MYTYEIEKAISTVYVDRNISLELNVISHNGAEAKYDLRRWNTRNGEHIMSKGLAMTKEELANLKKVLNSMDIWGKKDGWKQTILLVET